MTLFERNKELTFVENYVWENLGWIFCEIAFSTPDWLFWALSWTYPLGNFFYGLSYERRGREGHGGGIGPF